MRTESAMTAPWEPVRRTWRDEPLSGWDGPHGDESDAHGVPDRLTAKNARGAKWSSHWEICKAQSGAKRRTRRRQQMMVMCEATHGVDMFVSRLRHIEVKCSAVRSKSMKINDFCEFN